MATGSEVYLCVDAYEKLKAEGIKARVVSMPSWELFEHQDQDYRDRSCRRTSPPASAVEQASTFGWAHYAGLKGRIIGMHTFGASAPLKDLQKKFGFTTEAIIKAAHELVGKMNRLAGSENHFGFVLRGSGQKGFDRYGSYQGIALAMP